MAPSAYVIPLLRGKEGSTNGRIVRFLSLEGPALIYDVAKALASESETKVHYPTVNRRVHDLVSRGYLAAAGTRETKSGAEASLFATTIRGDFGSLASGLGPRDQLRLVQAAGKKPNSPFSLLRLMLDRGLPFDLVQREFLTGIAEDVRNGYINIEALDEEVVCSAFAASMAKKLRAVMGEEKGKEYVESVRGMLESLVFSGGPKVDLQAFSALAGATAGTSSGGMGAGFSRSPFPATAKPARGWKNELKQMVSEMLRE